MWEVVLLVAAGAVGLWQGHVGLAVALALMVVLGIRNRRIERLRAWVVSEAWQDPPAFRGALREIVEVIYRRHRDMTRHQDRLSGLLEQFRRVSAAVPDALVVLSEGGQIEWVSQAAEALLGLQAPRDIGARLVNLVRHPDFRGWLERGDFSEALVLAITPHRELSIQGFPFDENLRLLVARDTTHLARLHDMRQQFVANVSHELRTPLTVLSGFIETLRDMAVGGPELAPHFLLMEEQARRMQRLLADLLTLSELETTPPGRSDEPVALSPLCRDVAEVADTLAANRAIAIRCEIPPDAALRGVPEELRSALMNLVGNAVRHTPDGGEVGIEWRVSPEAATLTVRDTGEGIAAMHLPHLTERFYRVDAGRSRATGGTGLGLSIVKHILRRHDAELVIESTLGVGSRFSCVFPATRVASPLSQN